MAGSRFIIKFGGGLITDKSNICTAKPNVISALSEVIKTAIAEGYSPIIVHGAGSFGHLKSKKYSLHLGNQGAQNSFEVVEEVRSDMTELNQLVCSHLPDCIVHPPRNWVRGFGAEFSGDLSRFEQPGLHVTFGDVVDCDSPADFGILSGDDICYRLATEVEDIDKLIFCMAGADGILRKPPDIATSSDLIEKWDGGDLELIHESEIDVTGGIALKLERGLMAAKMGIDVYFVNGEFPERVLSIIRGEPARCTLIEGTE